MARTFSSRRPTDQKGVAMFRTTALVLIALILAVAIPARTSAQSAPASRRLSFAELATTVMQNNLQLRAAALDVAVAEAQLAQARTGQLPQAAVSASDTRAQEQAGQTISFPNPFGPSPPVISFTLPPPNP
ncbi:MAG TPA: hypothetical protein VFT63_07670, partial [bacterium]|nr:hypothetical protein [bacterium]